LAQRLGQLEAVHRDFQSKYWADLKLLGQPCNFYALEPCMGDTAIQAEKDSDGSKISTQISKE
jgi:hypothetical protein